MECQEELGPLYIKAIEGMWGNPISGDYCFLILLLNASMNNLTSDAEDLEKIRVCTCGDGDSDTWRWDLHNLIVSTTS
jgi:hypothetical protein